MPRGGQYSRLRRELAEARHAKNLTQQQVAERLGKPQSFVSKYESGERNLDVVEFLEICGVLEVSPQQILKRMERSTDE